MQKIIIHYEYGGGFGSWADKSIRKTLVTDITLIQMVEQLVKSQNDSVRETLIKAIRLYVEKCYPGTYTGGEDSDLISNLRIEEIPDGARFRITEYDGWESVIHEFTPVDWW